jgi:peroxiredoxin
VSEPTEQAEQQQPAQPRVPLGPDRPAFKKSTRKTLALAMVIAAVTALVVGVLLASTRSNHTTPHVVTIPAADRSASPELLREAAAVNFHPNTAAGVGQVEGRPLTGTDPLSAKSLLAPGSVAPPFTLRAPTGKPLSLASLRGKAVLLELFATWCPHCAAEAPHLKAMYAKLPHDKYAFVGVNADSEDAASVLAYHIWFGLPFPALLDPGTDPGSFHSAGSPGPVSKQYKVRLYPTFYVIDPHGKVAWAATGEQPDALLLKKLHQASQAT